MIEIENPFLTDDNTEEMLWEKLKTVEATPELPEIDPTKLTPWYRERTPEQEKEIQAMKDRGETPPGHKKKKGVHSRRDITDNDLDLLELLFERKYLTKRQIAFAMNRADSTINNRLKGLQELGLVGNIEPHVTRMLWYPKKAAVKTMEAFGRELPPDYVLIREDQLGTGELAHTLAVNQAAIHFSSPRGQIKGMKNVSSNRMISETRILKQFGRALTQDGFSGNKSEFGELSKTKARFELNRGALEYSELLNKYPELWVLTNAKVIGMKTSEWSSPDLVINFEDKRKGAKPVSLAVEVELTKKTEAGAYERIMETYKADKLVYGAVIWVVKDEKIEKVIRKACEAINFPKERVHFTRLVAADGQPYTKAYDL